MNGFSQNNNITVKEIMSAINQLQTQLEKKFRKKFRNYTSCIHLNVKSHFLIC